MVGVDTRVPRLPLMRTEFVKADASYAILQRMVRATQVDTVLHTHLEVDSTRASSRHLHEVNVIGTMNLLAAAAAEGSAVRKIVLKSSTLVYGSSFDDPYFFRETMPPRRAPTTPVERSLVDVDAMVDDFVEDHPEVSVHDAAVRQRARRRRQHRVLTDAAHARGAGGAGLRPAPAVRARGRRDPALRVRHRARPARHLQRGGPGHDHVERSVPRRRPAVGWRCRRCSPEPPRCRCGCCASSTSRRRC